MEGASKGMEGASKVHYSIIHLPVLLVRLNVGRYTQIAKMKQNKTELACQTKSAAN